VRVTEAEKKLVDEWIQGLMTGVFQPRPEQEIWEWAEENLRFPATESQTLEGQLWRSATTPYVRTIMKWVRSSGQQEMFISKSSQVGITLGIIIIIVWMIVHQPTNIGYYIDSTDEAKKISRTRLKRWILDNKVLDDVGEDEEDMNALVYFFRGMTVYFHGSYSGGAYRNKSLGLAILDELDAHPPIDDEGTTADLARGRVKVPPNSKLIGFSTPTVESGQTWSEYLTGTKEKLFCKCPHCDHMQPLEWKRVRFDHCKDLAEQWDNQKLLTDTYYECEMGCEIEQRDKPKLFDEIEWRATNKNPVPNKRSLHISDLYSPFVSWGKLATEWVEAQRNLKKLQNFIQQRLGEPFKESAGELKEADVLRLRQNYKKGTIPVPPVLVSMTVDVQKSTQKYVKQAWTRNGDMYVIDWGEVGTWEGVLEEFNRPIPASSGDEEYHVTSGFVDEGDGNRHMEVRRFCLPLLPHVWPVKGRGGKQVKDLIYTSTKYYVDGEYMYTYHVDDHSFKKELLHGRIKRDKKNAEYCAPRLFLPRRQDVDPGFVEELLNERLEFRINKYGYEEHYWKKSGDNDYLDCLKYALALWMVLEPEVTEENEDDNEEES